LPEHSLLGRSSAELTAIFYCLIWNSPNLEGRAPAFISPRNRLAQFTPRHWVPFLSPLTTRRDYSGSILTRLYTGKWPPTVYLFFFNHWVMHPVARVLRTEVSTILVYLLLKHMDRTWTAQRTLILTLFLCNDYPSRPYTLWNIGFQNSQALVIVLENDNVTIPRNSNQYEMKLRKIWGFHGVVVSKCAFLSYETVSKWTST
jgi:hypothetical protein